MIKIDVFCGKIGEFTITNQNRGNLLFYEPGWPNCCQQNAILLLTGRKWTMPNSSKAKSHFCEAQIERIVVDKGARGEKVWECRENERSSPEFGGQAKRQSKIKEN
jgi:hypothetical protein